MANLKHIQEQIKSVSSIQKVTKAMKMVAAAKLKRAQERMEQARPYSDRLGMLINNLLMDDKLNDILPLLEKRDNIRMSIPNLLSRNPVCIFLCVSVLILGFILIDMEIFFNRFFAN